MITPWFRVEQDDVYVIIVIKAKHIKISSDSEPEIDIGEFEFKFYCKPYYLRLHFTKQLVEDGEGSAEYENGFFRIKIPKLNPGEHFEDLNMLTKLLTLPGKSSASAPSIETIGDENDDDDEKEEEEVDWHIEQTVAKEEDEEDDSDDENISLTCPKYGFAHTRHGVFKSLQQHLWNVIDLKNADEVSEMKRKEERMKEEDAIFDEDHYLADLHQCEMIDHLIRFESEWSHMRLGNKNNDSDDSLNNNNNNNEVSYKFTEEEEEVLLKLPRKRYILEKSQKSIACLGLMDILYAFAYDHRSTEGDHSVESGWTICKVSSTLSWLDSFEDLRSVLVACIRRTLTFPLYRNFSLALCVCKDVVSILRRGREYVLHCMVKVRSLLLDQDDHYLLNQLYVDDYCVWLQSVKATVLLKLADQIEVIKVSKGEVGLELLELEEAALHVIEEGKEKKVVVVAEGGHDSDDGSNDGDSDDDDDSTSSGVDSDDEVSKRKENKLCEKDEGNEVDRNVTGRVESGPRVKNDVDACAEKLTNMNL